MNKARDNSSVKAARWLFWSVLSGVVPILSEMALAYLSDKFHLFVILGKGELMLIGSAVGFPAVAELIGNNKNQASAKSFWSGLCIACSFLEAVTYVALKASGQSVNGVHASIMSLILFATSLISGYVCISLSE